MKTHHTQNDLADNAKKTAIDLLNKRLADTIDLALLTKQAHWNLKGRNFIAVHEMLDMFRATIDKHVDIIAERAAQLGGQPAGTTQAVEKATSIAPYPVDLSAVDDHLKALAERYATAANEMRESIDQADDAGDADTADIFTAASRDLDKALWFIEAHIEK